MKVKIRGKGNLNYQNQLDVTPLSHSLCIPQEQFLGQLRAIFTDLALSPQIPGLVGRSTSSPWVQLLGHGGVTLLPARDAGLGAAVSGCRCLTWC